MARKGLAQANTLRSNNTTSTGYGVIYADEVSGHRTVPDLSSLFALYDWQLSASGDNTNNDAIGQLWYVVDADGSGNGSIYQLTDWNNRTSGLGWTKFTAGSGSGGGSITVDSALSTTSTNPVQNKVVTAKFDEVSTTYVKNDDLVVLTSDEIDEIWNSN